MPLRNTTAGPCSVALSILYLRCVDLGRRRYDIDEALSILYLRCPEGLCGRICLRRAGPFNSLFEMRETAAADELHLVPIFAFNSLFEMRRRSGQQPRPQQVDPLSILYLRCAPRPYTRVTRRQASGFQFSI